jgi:DNA-binding transcriptional ArsR family regulator
VLVCEALADESRVQIVELLARRDMTAGAIAEHFTVSRPAVSKHLRVLRDAGLVTVTPDANRRIYRLDPQPLNDLASWAEQQRQTWEHRLDALGRHLDAKARRRARQVTNDKESR